MKVNLSIRLNAIEEYLKNKNLKAVAHKYNVNYSTLSRWVKKFKNNQGGLYHRPWNRISREIEEKVMHIKENIPAITLGRAKILLEKEGINISLKGIYDIWSRYGLIKKLFDDPFSFFSPETSETKDNIEYVRYLLKKDKSSANLKKAAEILNNFPSYPAGQDDILEQIPEKFLSLRRRFDKLYNQFLKIPTPEFYRKIHTLRIRMEKRGLYYSSIIAGLSEILVLHWMRTPHKELKLNALLVKRKGKLRDPILNFQLTFLAATAKVELMEIDDAKSLVRKMRRLLKRLPFSPFYESYGDVMTFMSDYRTALIYHQKALETAKDEDAKKRLYFKIALNLTIDGKHRTAIKYLNIAKIDFKDKYYESYALTRALSNFGLVGIEQSLLYLQKALEKSEKEQFRNTIFTTICCYAAINRAMGQKQKARKLLQHYLKLIRKYKLKREIEIMENLINTDSINPKITELPTVYLLYLIKKAKKSSKIKDYNMLIDYARRYGITGFLHRCLIFFPEPVLNSLNRGKNPKLPVTMLRLPVFNSESLLYYIKFLGEPVVHRNQKYLKIKFEPKEMAFLIHFALRASEPDKSLVLDEIYKNFFSSSKNPQSRLSHLLVNLKNKLMMPRHLLVIQSHFGAKVLVNKGFYLNIDYNDFNATLVRAKALQRAGEWEFARREYLRAFKLFRGEPFKKNYDEWSLNMRFKILSQLETEAINFAKSCVEHGDKTKARQILQKVLIIIPDSEINGLIKSLNG